MDKSKLLLGSASFMSRLKEVAEHAKHTLLVQAMTFEGDDAGIQLIDLMINSPAKSKRLLIDSYSKKVINDHFIFSIKFLIDKDFRKEIRATRSLLKEAESLGIQVKFTNPIGWFGQKYPLRNHKKMIVVDKKVSYLGGVNFSDHNFSWHDMMIELNDEEVGNALFNDFNETWEGNNQSKKVSARIGEIFFLNGSKSKKLYHTFFEEIRSARESIHIISPYISEPLLGVLQSVSKGGVRVTIISPKENNKSIFKNIILSENEKGYFNLEEFGGMSHMKAILVDNKKLIFGSSNYDLISYYFEQEVVMISYDQLLIESFKNEVLSKTNVSNQDLKITSFKKWKARVIMKFLNGFGFIASSTFLRPH